MTTQDNPSILSITSLPNEVLKIVFKNVDWKTIYNVKLVSRFFNSFINSNLKYLPKPRLMGLTVSSFEENNGSIQFSYKLINSITTIDIENFYFPMEKNKIDKFKNYISRMDLTNIVNLTINTTGKTIVFDILNNYFFQNTQIYYLKLFIDKNEGFKSFSSFIQKIKYVTHFHIKKICFPNQIIPKNFTLSMIEDMRNISISECDCTHFVNPQMINNIFDHNKELLKIEILSKCYNFEDNLLKNIRNRQDFCNGNRDCHNNYHVTLTHHTLIGAYLNVRNFFPCGSYNVVSDRRNIGRFDAYKQCEKCNFVKCITFQYYKSYSRKD